MHAFSHERCALKNLVWGEEMYSDVENKLYSYTTSKIEIKKLKMELSYAKLELRDIRNSYQGCKAINYSYQTLTETNNISDSVANEVLEKMQLENDKEAIILLKRRKIQFLTFRVKKIENAISILDEEERFLVEYRYFSKTKPSWHDVSEKLGYSERTCREKRDKILKKIKKYI